MLRAATENFNLLRSSGYYYSIHSKYTLSTDPFPLFKVLTISLTFLKMLLFLYSFMLDMGYSPQHQDFHSGPSLLSFLLNPV